MDPLVFAAADPDGWAALGSLATALLLLANLVISARSLFWPAKARGDESASKADLEKLDAYAHAQAHDLRDALHAQGIRLGIVETKVQALAPALDRLSERVSDNTRMLSELIALAKQSRSQR